MNPVKAVTAISWLDPKTNPWKEAVCNLVFPAVCQICHSQRAGLEEGYVCRNCRGGVRFLEAPFCSRCGLPYPGQIDSTFSCSNCSEELFFFSWARASVVVSNLVLESVHRYKYSGHLYFEHFLVQLFVSGVFNVFSKSDWDFIVPVPLHPLRLRERGFNQAERLGDGLSQATGIPVNVRLLERVEQTKTQTALSREERRQNMKCAFRLAKNQTANGLRIVIVDDILTTGATTNACARVLRDAGAAEVAVGTLARGLVGASAPSVPVKNPPSTVWPA